MYIEKLEIQGFKSFADKNVLSFPGSLSDAEQGLTAIVGPNGSGKSNVADAIRWVLGEQSLKTIRGKKADDVIFSGTEKRKKLGMAEVALYLNNADKQAPIDYTELVIKRRVYRDGNSEYLINNSRVRLIDVQMLLAKANVGQKTYSVVGQGTVDNFLNSSLADRKEFFDEATGVKQYQIKRDSSLNKLRLSYENLSQAQMLLSEIEPRLNSLTRQVKKLRKRGELEKELKEHQLKYYYSIWHENNNKFRDYNNKFLVLEKEKHEKDKKLSFFNKELEKYEVSKDQESEYDVLERDLRKYQDEKENQERQLARIDAHIEVQLESVGKFDLSFFILKKEELTKDIKKIDDELARLKESIKDDKEEEIDLKNKNEKLVNDLEKLNNKLFETKKETSDSVEPEMEKKIREVIEKIKLAEGEEEMQKIKEIISAIKTELEKLFLEEKEEIQESENWQGVHEEIKKLSKEKEEISGRINDNILRISARSERINLLDEKNVSLRKELEDIESKIKQNSDVIDVEEITSKRDNMKGKIAETDEIVADLKNKMSRLNKEEEKKRSHLLGLQKNIQELQMEINNLVNELNDLKVHAARHETRLEDIEVEIRDELGGMSDIKGGELDVSGVDLGEVKESIVKIKRQLELIGGIDPEVEKEYGETKERFDYLSGQVTDLTSAIDSLENIIKELDITIRKKFDKEFKVIAGKFQEYFKILFGGGTAKIEKVVEEEDPSTGSLQEGGQAGQGEEEMKESQSGEGEENLKDPKKKNETHNIVDVKKIKFLQKHNATGLAGVEIYACPPGKKITSINVLSGGEKALTAIALICAIIRANPAPFVVLDEVDAALDEANSERLAKILEDLSHRTQFIVITHNRASMKKASVLYGVTMGDDGVSKLLSVKMGEAVDKARY